MNEHGPRWVKIGSLMGLSQYQVSNKYMNLNKGNPRNTGARSRVCDQLREETRSAQGHPARIAAHSYKPRRA